jgi:TadE-like protein
MTPARMDEGQSSVELALVLPLVALLLLVIVQTGVVAYRQVLVVNAAREGARAAAVDPVDFDVAALRAAERAGPLDLRRLTADANEDDGLVRVEVSYVEPTDVALIVALLPDVTLEAHVTMRVER